MAFLDPSVRTRKPPQLLIPMTVECFKPRYVPVFTQSLSNVKCAENDLLVRRLPIGVVPSAATSAALRVTIGRTFGVTVIGAAIRATQMKGVCWGLVDAVGVEYGDTSDTHEPVDGIIVRRWCGKGTLIQWDVQMHNSHVAGMIRVMVQMPVRVG